VNKWFYVERRDFIMIKGSDEAGAVMKSFNRKGPRELEEENRTDL